MKARLFSLLAVAVLCGWLLASYSLQRAGLRFATVSSWRPQALELGYTTLAAVAFVAALVPAMARRRVLLLGSLIVGPLLLGWPAAALIFSNALVICLLARSRLKLRYQLALAALLWTAALIARASIFARAPAGGFGLAVVWAATAYATLYLLVEHAQGVLAGRRFTDLLFYLLAPPRFVEPFFQPLSPRYLYSAESPLDLHKILRAAALGAFSLALAAAASFLRRPELRDAGIAADLATGYCFAAHQIFASVTIFRLMGYDLASGFRRPYAAQSFADFFRRWNFYVRDAVITLFFLPVLGWLRHRLPRRAATVAAAYLAIFAGSFAMNDLLIPVATSADPLAAAEQQLDRPARLLLLFVYWSAIILPRAGFGSVEKLETGFGWKRWLRTARFLALLFVLWWAARMF